MTAKDRNILRELARRVAEVAATPHELEKPDLWEAQNRLEPIRPLIFISPEGAWDELLPPSSMECEDEDARGLEYGLRMRLYAAEHFSDDQQCDHYFNVGPVVHMTGWGLAPETHAPEQYKGASVWDAPVKTLDDVELIQTPTARLDEEATARNLAFYDELLGDILEVRLRGQYWWALGLIDEWTMLRGITQTYMDMLDNPELLRAGMQRLSDGRLAWLKSLEEQGALCLNNGNDYVGSGSFGYTAELPQRDFEGTVRLKDMWGFTEAQTMSEVSPAMHEEFVLPYQLPILEQFGLTIYGCCEPLHLKLDFLMKRVPHLRRVSISPWADKRISAEKLGNKVIYNWKPNPATLAGVQFDPEWVRQDIRETLEIARANDCVLDIVLKDTHTCNGDPARFDQWGRIAREEVMRSLE